jgi:regulator of replication initiation timing
MILDEWSKLDGANRAEMSADILESIYKYQDVLIEQGNEINRLMSESNKLSLENANLKDMLGLDNLFNSSKANPVSLKAEINYFSLN